MESQGVETSCEIDERRQVRAADPSSNDITSDQYEWGTNTSSEDESQNFSDAPDDIQHEGVEGTEDDLHGQDSLEGFIKDDRKQSDQEGLKGDERETRNCPKDQNSAQTVPRPSTSSSSNSSRTSNKVHIVVWNKGKNKWLKGADNRGKTSEEDQAYFRIHIPSAKDLQQREQGARSSRCPPDAISNLSKTIKKGRRVQSLKHIDYKKFLQCYIHVQELKDFKVDGNFNKNDSDEGSGGKRKRKTISHQQQRPSKTSKMAMAGVEYGQAGHFDNMPTLGLVQHFDTQMMQIDTSSAEHSFTVDLEGIDDVANFEQVDLTDNFSVPSPAQPPPSQQATTTSSSSVVPSHHQPSEEVSPGSSSDVSFDESKPRCTYTDLIEQALTESGGLTVSEIYQWISDHYPFFRPDDDRWKNSVRHNLSINPYFKKGEKAKSGAGHLWTISEESRALRPSLRKDSDCEDVPMNITTETDRAVAKILGQYHISKNNMEGKPSTTMIQPIPQTQVQENQKNADASLCTPPPPEQPNLIECQQSCCPTTMDELSPQILECQQIENCAVENMENMDVPPVVICDNSGFQAEEYTIDLTQFHFPDTTTFTFDDLMMPSTSLIVIPAEDQDAGNIEVQNLNLCEL